MASGPHTFTIVGVFSAEQFRGNRLPIVSVRGNAFDHRQKRLIAREFGCSETVFIYDAAGPGLPRRIDVIPERGEEVTFSGHSILGVAHYIFNCCELKTTPAGDKPITTILMTKAGPVPVLYNPQRQVAACGVPHKFYIHRDKLSFDRVIDVQPQIQIVPTIENVSGSTSPVVSLIPGMSFGLVNLTEAPDILGAVKAGKDPDSVLDEGHTSDFRGTVYYTQKESMAQDGEPTIHSLQVRVMTRGFEDPGTGSACSTLASYLALNGGKATAKESEASQSETEKATRMMAEVSVDSRQSTTERHVYAIQQGVEMARGCTIAVEVEINVDKEGIKQLSRVTLSGRSCLFAKGELL